MQSTNSFEWLMNFGSSSEAVILIGAPFLILCAVGIVIVVMRVSKGKREAADLDEESDSEGRAKDRGPNAKDSRDEDPSWTGDFSKETLVTKPELSGPPSRTWLSRLREGLSKTRASLSSSVSGLFSGGQTIDESTLERLHEVLYRADIGVDATERLVAAVRKTSKQGIPSTWDTVRNTLKSECLGIFSDVQPPPEHPADSIRVILVVGVNGVGKTTTIGKLASRYCEEGLSVVLCAADTFRAAAIEQLKVWGERIGVPVIAKQQGADPASVVFDAVASAKARKADVLIIDTAGRLHNKNDLMSELEKVYRVIGREIPGAPHDAWLVIDATTGQNAFAQVKAFAATAKINGLIVTKLDGTARGGVVLGICQQFKLPIQFLGVGETAEDLSVFNPAEFVDTLFE